MHQDHSVIAEIGILLHPDVRLAAVHGLTDLFRIAGDISTALAATVRRSASAI